MSALFSYLGFSKSVTFSQVEGVIRWYLGVSDSSAAGYVMTLMKWCIIATDVMYVFALV